MARLMFPSFVIKNVDPKVSARSENVSGFSDFQQGQGGSYHWPCRR